VQLGVHVENGRRNRHVFPQAAAACTKNDRFNWMMKGSAFSGCLITAPEVHFT